MINVSIDIVKLLLFVLVAYSSYKVFSSLSKMLRYKRILNSWLDDEEKLRIYNKFKEYMETDIYTGLRKPVGGMVGDIPVIECRQDYENLGAREQNIVQATMAYLNDMPDLEDFDKKMTEYLESAKEIKKLRGF